MKRHRSICFALLLLVLCAGYTVTRGNVVWRIKTKYPHSQIYFDAENPSVGCFGGFIRCFGIKYFSGKTPVGVVISDVIEPIDLWTFKGMCLEHVRFENCRFTDIALLLTLYRPWVTFKDCDLMAIPPEQKKCLSYSKEFNHWIIDGKVMSDDYPSGFNGNVGLHSYWFYP